MCGTKRLVTFLQYRVEGGWKEGLSQCVCCGVVQTVLRSNFLANMTGHVLVQNLPGYVCPRSFCETSCSLFASLSVFWSDKFQVVRCSYGASALSCISMTTITSDSTSISIRPFPPSEQTLRTRNHTCTAAWLASPQNREARGQTHSGNGTPVLDAYLYLALTEHHRVAEEDSEHFTAYAKKFGDEGHANRGTITSTPPPSKKKNW